MLLKSIKSTLFLCLATVACLAQNNTFPASGNVGIGTPTPSYKLDVREGGISVSGRNPIASINGFGNALQLLHPNTAAIVYNPGEESELMFGFHSGRSFFWGSKLSGYRMSLSDTGHLRVYGSLQVGSKYLSGYELSVDGKMAAREVMVTLSGWPDYVFQPDYTLRPLDELALYIQKNSHLPGIPTAKEVEANGVNLGDMNKKLLEKVEELTLYIINQHEKVEAMDRRLQQLEEKTKD